MKAMLAKYWRCALTATIGSWRLWCILSGLVTTAIALFLLFAFLGYRYQQPTTRFPNALTLDQSATGVERMRINLSASGARPAFIGVALSGGGSRASNFSIAVLQELDRIGILQYTEALSSVSGGSLAAVDMALHLDGPPTESFWERAYKRLGIDFERELVRAYLRPSTFLRTFYTSEDRGDVLAAVFDRFLFENKTFASIPPVGPSGYKPSLFVNATVTDDPILRSAGAHPDPRLSIGLYMSTFTYSHERFSEMTSDLRTMPLSYAVASSAAFPAAINPVTLQLANFADSPKGRVFYAKRYIHLADGGLSDNLGTDTLRKVFETRMRYQRDLTQDRETIVDRACLIIAVDATSPPKYGPRQNALRPDGRTTWWSSLVDATAVYGYDAYLLRRRADQLDEMNIDSAAADYGRYSKTRPTSVVASDLRSRYARYQQSGMYYARPTVFTRTQVLDETRPSNIDTKRYKCTIWHIALEDLDVRRSRNFNNDSEREQAKKNSDRNDRLANIADTALSLETAFRLHSSISPECSASDLQAVLRRAAQELVHDEQNKKLICAWMEKAHLDKTRCLEDPVKLENVSSSCIRRAQDPGMMYIEKQSSDLFR